MAGDNTKRRLIKSSTLSLLAALLLFLPGSSAPRNAISWRLIWGDEFDGPARSKIDLNKWTPETGGAGWGNKELQFYTDRSENVYIDGKGSLVISAIELKPDQKLECWYGRCKYSSARLITKNRFDQQYGKIEARIRIPFGQGLWPAFWMLGNDIDSTGWPGCGEIDIMENIGREPSIVHGTIHGPGYSGGNAIGGPYRLKEGQRFADNFHVFAVEWEPGQIRWYVDGEMYQRRTPADLPKDAKWVFDHPFFIILNVAVGGNWPGAPDRTTEFPQKMEVDYVRVYKR
ncbi:MAG TPA: glycoside hydrolase family 16 protein [Blastocatellia bacterium]|nr:glycoside hydrolase family 16 protein [Blastocatellia bacterium]